MNRDVRPVVLVARGRLRACSMAIAAWCMLALPAGAQTEPPPAAADPPSADAPRPARGNAQPAPRLPRFSLAKAAGPIPGWQPLTLASFKLNTEYTLVEDDGAVVLRAVSNKGASLLGLRTSFDPHDYPILVWRWKIVKGLPEADTRERAREDAPARVMVSFAGDTRKLSFKDRAAAAAASTISGEALPYAQIMYIWGGKVEVGSVTTSQLSSRIRMIAVGADNDGVGEWRRYSRNLVDDFKRAFNEEPGEVTAVSIMTDADNTGGSAEALYGDLIVVPR